MPYYVDSPLASGLGFAAAYMQGKQQRSKDQTEQQQQESQLAIQQAQQDRLAQQATTDATKDQQEQDRTTKMIAWDTAHPAPDPGDAKAYGKYVAARSSYANSIGFYDQAKSTMADFRTGQQAQEYGATSAYTSGAKTANTNANTELTKSRTQFEKAHAQNERGRFAHELAVIKQRDGDAAARAVQTAQMHIGAMLQANSARIGAQLGIAQMNNDTRESISMRGALLSQQYHSDEMGLQAAIAQYKGDLSSYLKNDANSAAGKPTDPGFQPGASMPVINVNNAQQPQQQAPQFVIMQMPMPDGSTKPVVVPHVTQHKSKFTVTTRGANAPKPAPQPQGNWFQNLGGWAQQQLHNAGI
jgi:hypothetical protein